MQYLLKKPMNILAGLLILALMVCQPYSEEHRGGLEGRILDTDGKPMDGIIVIRGLLGIPHADEWLILDTSLHEGSYKRDTTDIYGKFELKFAMNYFSSSEPNSMGCASNDAFSSLEYTYLGFANNKNDTLIVLFSPYENAESDTNFYHFGLDAFADSTIFLDVPRYDFYEFPDPFKLPDIIDHRSIL